MSLEYLVHRNYQQKMSEVSLVKHKKQLKAIRSFNSMEDIFKQVSQVTIILLV